MTSPRIHATLEGLRVPISRPVPFGKNPRRGDVAKIARSLMENGQYKPITLREGTNEVLAGNHTLAAAKQLGWDEIAVTYAAPADDDDALRIVLVDNYLNDVATYDEKALAEALSSLPDPMHGTGMDMAAVEAAIYGVNQEPVETPEGADDAPPAPTERPVTRLGDVWELGGHRLVCGKAESATIWQLLMGEERAHLMWTDPPYGVDYVGKTKDKLTIENDGAHQLAALLDGSFRRAAEYLRPGAPIYVAHADTERVTFELALTGTGFLVRQNLVWVKNTMILGHSDYHWKHEPILHAQAPGDATEEDLAGPAEDGNVVELFREPGSTSGKQHTPLLYGFAPGGKGRLGRGGPRWYGPNNGTTVFEFPKPAASRDHPTMKPVALILAHMANSIRPGGVVLDPFAGSGSTMVAAEAHGVHARMIELDPRYCDVIAMRWQKHTGRLPRRNGKEHRFPVQQDEE